MEEINFERMPMWKPATDEKHSDKRHWLSMDHGSYNYCISLFPVINSKTSLTWLKTKHYSSILEEDSVASPSSLQSLKHLLTLGNFK